MCMKGRETKLYAGCRSAGNRVAAFLLALAMIVSSLAWGGFGRTEAKAAEREITFYYYHECQDGNELALASWFWEGIKPPNTWKGNAADGTAYYAFEKTDDANWYKITLSYNKDLKPGDNQSFGIVVSEATSSGSFGIKQELTKFVLNGENESLYRKIFESGISDPAYNGEDIISYATKESVPDPGPDTGEDDTGTDDSEQGDSQLTEKVRFYYYNTRPDFQPAYKPWNGDSLSLIPADGNPEDGKAKMTPVSEGSAWYYIDILYNSDSYAKDGMGLDIFWYNAAGEEIWPDSGDVDRVDLKSSDENYKLIFNGTYKDPAYKDGKIGSYAILTAAKTSEDLKALLATVPSDYDTASFTSDTRESLKTAVTAVEAYIKAPDSEANPDTLYENLQAALDGLRYQDDNIVVEKVPGISSDFIKGVDISSYLSLTKSGVKFYNFAGEEVDSTGFFQTFADAGVNYVRLRVWNDPKNAAGEYYGGGNNDLETTKTICSQIAAYNRSDADSSNNLKVLIDFHYSDFWVDPDKQKAPKAWASMTLDEKAAALKDYTIDSLRQIAQTGVEIGMVQIGNETNNGICGETGEGVYTIFRAGCEAIDSYNAENGTNILKLVHYTDPHKGDEALFRAQELIENDVEYDVYATSYYPYWHGTVDDLKATLSEIAEKTEKMVMVTETQDIYTNDDYDGCDNQAYEGKTNIDLSAYSVSVQGQANEIRDVINAVASIGDAGLGVFYWEPAWLPVGNAYNEDGTRNESAYAKNDSLWKEYGSGWAAPAAAEFDESVEKWGYGGTNCENAALFDFTGHPLASLNVFKYVDYGTAGAQEHYYGYKFAVKSVTAKVGMRADEIKALLPADVTVINNYGNETDAAVAWDQAGLASIAEKIAGNAAAGNTYTAEGTVTYAGETKTVKMPVEVIPAENKLVNGDFEALDQGWEFGNYTFAKEDPSNSKGNVSGKFETYNFAETDTAPYATYVKQTVTLTEPGTYSLIGFAEGGAETGAASAGEAIYLQAMDGTGKIYKSGNLVLQGWMIWQKASVDNILITQEMVDAGQNTLEVAWMLTLNADRWGTLDDTYLFRVGDVAGTGSGTPLVPTPVVSQPSTGTTEPSDTGTAASPEEDRFTVVEKSDGSKQFVDSDGKVVTNQVVAVDDVKYFAKADGTIAKAEFCTTPDGELVYALADGVLAANKVFAADGKRYFAKADGTIARSGFYKTEKGNTIYARSNGTLITGRSFAVNGKRYYAADTGAVVKSGFYETANGKKVYAKASGALVTGGTFKVDGKRYYANKNGVIAVNKWVKVGNRKYYCSASGAVTKVKIVKK